MASLAKKQDSEIKEKGLEATLSRFREVIKSNAPLHESLYRITFTNIEKSTSAFGDINELIQGLVDKKVSENVATDLVSYRFNYEI